MAESYGQSKVHPSPHGQAVGGIILRDYVAAAALEGLLAGNAPEKDPTELAKLAVAYADALVLQLQPKKKVG